MAHVRQSRPDSGLGVQAKVLRHKYFTITSMPQSCRNFRCQVLKENCIPPNYLVSILIGIPGLVRRLVPSRVHTPQQCSARERLGIRRRPGAEALEREFCIDNLLVRIHFIIVMIRWTGLAPWEFESPFPGSLTSTFLAKCRGPLSIQTGLLESVKVDSHPGNRLKVSKSRPDIRGERASVADKGYLAHKKPPPPLGPPQGPRHMPPVGS